MARSTCVLVLPETLQPSAATSADSELEFVLNTDPTTRLPTRHARLRKSATPVAS